MKFSHQTFIVPLAGFLLSLLLFFISSGAIAAPERVVLTTGYNYSPYTGEGLPQGGMVTEIISSLLKEMGLEPEYLRLPWKRALKVAEQEQLFGTFPWEPRSDLNTTFFYSDPIILLDAKTYVDANATLIPESSQDLLGLKLCLPLGHRTYGLIGKMVRDGSLLTTSPANMEQCFKLLKGGRVDLVSVSGMVARQYAKQVYGYVDGVQALRVASTRTTFHLLITKFHPDARLLIKRFNAELKRMRAQNKLIPIIERHLWVR